MIVLKQFFDLNETLSKEVEKIENECELVSEQLKTAFKQSFASFNEKLVIELTRSIKGRQAKKQEIFKEDYESFIEIGLEYNGQYFPNAYIPVWKCKKELFQYIGYLTKYEPIQIKEKMISILNEMLEDRD